MEPPLVYYRNRNDEVVEAGLEMIGGRRTTARQMETSASVRWVLTICFLLFCGLAYKGGKIEPNGPITAQQAGGGGALGNPHNTL